MFQQSLSTCVASALLLCAFGAGPITPALLHAQQIIGKHCDHCGNAVPIATSHVHGVCPHCFVRWTNQRDQYVYGKTVPSQIASRSLSEFDPLLFDDTDFAPSETDAIWSPGERYRLKRSRPDWVDVHDTETDEVLKFPHDRRASIRREFFSTDEKVFITLTGGRISVWDLETGSRRGRYGRGVVEAAFLPDEHALAILDPNNLYFRSADTGAIVYGRITPGRGRFLDLVLRFSETDGAKVFVRTTNERGGIYDLDGTRISKGQRLPRRSISDATQLTLRN